LLWFHFIPLVSNLAQGLIIVTDCTEIGGGVRQFTKLDGLKIAYMTSLPNCYTVTLH